MEYINIKKSNGKYKCRAEINGHFLKAEYDDIILAAVWAEEIAAQFGYDGENKNGTII